MGIVWLCTCECGGEREVPAMYFTSGRIKRCEECVDPRRVSTLIQTRAAPELEVDEEEDDAGWYPEPFRSNWRDVLNSFDPPRRLLFEVVMADRRRNGQLMMQATDIVARTPESDIDIELGSFSRKRIAAALARVRSVTTIGDDRSDTQKN